MDIIQKILGQASKKQESAPQRMHSYSAGLPKNYKKREQNSANNLKSNAQKSQNSAVVASKNQAQKPTEKKILRTLNKYCRSYLEQATCASGSLRSPFLGSLWEDFRVLRGVRRNLAPPENLGTPWFIQAPSNCVKLDCLTFA